MKRRENAAHKAMLRANGLTRNRAIPSRAARFFPSSPGRRVEIGKTKYVWHLTGALLRVEG